MYCKLPYIILSQDWALVVTRSIVIGNIIVIGGFGEFGEYRCRNSVEHNLLIRAVVFCIQQTAEQLSHVTYVTNVSCRAVLPSTCTAAVLMTYNYIIPHHGLNRIICHTIPARYICIFAAIARLVWSLLNAVCFLILQRRWFSSFMLIYDEVSSIHIMYVI